MKKGLLYLLVLLSCMGVVEAQRMVLLEHFTQASCPPCATYNPALNSLLDQNLDKVVAIKYQTSWPGTDPMNADNPSDVGTRVNYYGVSGVPNSVMDGNYYNGSPTGVNQGKINTRGNTSAKVKTTVSYTLIDKPAPVKDSMTVTATVKAITSIVAGYVLHMVAIEREINFVSAPGSNGEKKFESVMKKMLPSATGTTLSALAAGDSVTYTYKWAITKATGTPVYYNVSNAAAVAFVQNNSTKEVLGAGYDEPRPWVQLSKSESQKSVRIKGGQDVTFPFTCVSRVSTNQQIYFKALQTGLPAGWAAKIFYNGNQLADTASIALPGNSSIEIGVKVIGPNAAVLNKKIAVKLEVNSKTIFPVVKSTMAFTAITPSNILFIDLPATATYRFTEAFLASTQPFCSITGEDQKNLDTAGLNSTNIKKIFYSTGGASTDILTKDKCDVLTAYLNSGGNLFVMGQDVGMEVSNSLVPEAQPFYSEKLGADFIDNGANDATIVSKVDEDLILAPAFVSTLTLPAASTSYPDRIAVSTNAPNSAAFLKYATDEIAGVHNSGPNWKTVYVAFRMESIGISGAPATFRNALIKRSNAWFDNTLTSVEFEQSFASAGQAYPNPAHTNLFVPVSGQGSGKIQLTNVTGQIVREIQLDATQKGVQSLSLEGLKPGIYFLQSTRNDSDSSVQKIVVQ